MSDYNTRVRFKDGVKDCDFPELCLGGLTGVVYDIFPDSIGIQFDEQSLQRIPEEIKLVCEASYGPFETAIYYASKNDVEFIE
jgi:hypothetical protein